MKNSQEKEKRISNSVLPTKIPLLWGLVIFLMIDRFSEQIPDWLKGIIWFIYGFWFLVSLVLRFYNTEYINPFEKELDDETRVKLSNRIIINKERSDIN